MEQGVDIVAPRYGTADDVLLVPGDALNRPLGRVSGDVLSSATTP